MVQKCLLALCEVHDRGFFPRWEELSLSSFIVQSDTGAIMLDPRLFRTPFRHDTTIRAPSAQCRGWNLTLDHVRAAFRFAYLLDLADLSKGGIPCIEAAHTASGAAEEQFITYTDYCRVMWRVFAWRVASPLLYGVWLVGPGMNPNATKLTGVRVTADQDDAETPFPADFRRWVHTNSREHSGTQLLDVPELREVIWSRKPKEERRRGGDRNMWNSFTLQKFTFELFAMAKPGKRLNVAGGRSAAERIKPVSHLVAATYDYTATGMLFRVRPRARDVHVADNAKAISSLSSMAIVKGVRMVLPFLTHGQSSPMGRHSSTLTTAVRPSGLAATPGATQGGDTPVVCGDAEAAVAGAEPAKKRRRSQQASAAAGAGADDDGDDDEAVGEAEEQKDAFNGSAGEDEALRHAGWMHREVAQLPVWLQARLEVATRAQLLRMQALGDKPQAFLPGSFQLSVSPDWNMFDGVWPPEGLIAAVSGQPAHKTAATTGTVSPGRHASKLSDGAGPNTGDQDDPSDAGES